MAGNNGDDGDADHGDDSHDSASDHAEADGSDESHASRVAHDTREKGNILLKALQWLRSLFYFALGFGPVGWFGSYRGTGFGETLAYALGCGVIVAVLARVVMRLQNNELNSEISDKDLLLKPATVTVKIPAGKIGRVRVRLSKNYVDRYARCRKKEIELATGSEVVVVDFNAEELLVDLQP